MILAKKKRRERKRRRNKKIRIAGVAVLLTFLFALFLARFLALSLFYFFGAFWLFLSLFQSPLTFDAFRSFIGPFLLACGGFCSFSVQSAHF